MLDDQLSKKIRLGQVSPEEALQLLKDDKVYVWANAHAEPGGDWFDVEDAAAGGSDIQHSLLLVGAGDLAEAFSAEVKRLRDKGMTVESLYSGRTSA